MLNDDRTFGALSNGEPRILVLAKRVEEAQSLEGLLRQKCSGCAVAHAPSHSAALALLERGGFNLVVLDLEMEPRPGVEHLRALRAVEPALACVVMTEASQEAAGLQALRWGAQDYLLKEGIQADGLLRTCRYAIERRAAERDLLATHELLSRTLDGLPSCIAILDPCGIILAVNQAWSEYSDSSNPFIHGCRPGDNYLGVCDRLNASSDSIHAVAQEILPVLAGLDSLRRLDYGVPFEAPQAWFELMVHRATNAGGASFVVSHLDISERKNLEKRLRVSEELFTIITHNVPDLLAIIDAEGARHYTSPSYLKVLGYEKEEMAKLEATDLLHPEDRARVAASLRELFTHGHTRYLDYRLRHKDGSWRYFDSNGSLIANQQSRVPQALVVARDVTVRHKAEVERQQMESQLRQSQKLEAIGQLAAGIAHEINTPTQFIGDNIIFVRDSLLELFTCLHTLAGRVRTHLDATGDFQGLAELEALLEGLDLDYLEQEVPRAIEQSMDGVARVTRIVSAMKDFSHPSTDAKVPTDLNRAIESTVTVSSNVWKLVAEMHLDLDPGLPLVPCFPGEFNQAVLNLLVNAAQAIEAAPGGSGTLGRIRVGTRVQEGWAVVEIQDSGCGIPKAILDRIFDPFFTTKPVGKGTGQGLAIAHAVIVEQHGGRITVDSEPDRGSTFTLHLPLQEVDRG